MNLYRSFGKKRSAIFGSKHKAGLFVALLAISGLSNGDIVAAEKLLYPSFGQMALELNGDTYLSAVVTLKHRDVSFSTMTGIVEWHVYADPQYVHVRGSMRTLERLAAQQAVAEVAIDVELTPDVKQGLVLIGADKVRGQYDGSGVSIAIIDSGIDPTHPMLGGSAACEDQQGYKNSKVIGGWDSGAKDPLPCDSASHGTSVAGIAAGLIPDQPQGPGGDYVGGVAPGAKIYALKITKPNGRPGSNAYLDALRWIVHYWNADPANPIKVVTNSNSWGKVQQSCSVSSSAYEKKVARQLAKLNELGIIVFNSAGNAGFPDALQWPGCMDLVQSVGAVGDTTDKVLGSSNVHEMLDFLGPANPVITTAPGGYGKFGTTSAATPYAAGSAAVIQQAAKERLGAYLSPAALVELMKASGDMISDPKSTTGVRRPRINLARAIEQLQ